MSIIYSTLFFVFRFRFDSFLFCLIFLYFLSFFSFIFEYDPSGDVHFVVSDPHVVCALDPHACSFCRWSCALMRRMQSYFRVAFHCSAISHVQCIHWCMCVVTCLITFVMYSSSKVSCQIHAALTLIALTFLFLILLLCLSCSKFPFPFFVLCPDLRLATVGTWARQGLLLARGILAQIQHFQLATASTSMVHFLTRSGLRLCR